jgi:hypothetical protein
VTLTKAKLRSWRRRAVSLDARAKKLMDDMLAVLGAESENTDGIDDVTAATENLVDVLSRPELTMWGFDAHSKETPKP